MTPLEWFSRLFGEAESGWLTVSTKQDSSTRNTPGDPFKTDWFHVHDLPSAAGMIANLGDVNVYFGLGLRRSRLGVGQRGCASDVCAIPGVWVEIDVADGTHAGTAKTYFPDKPSALEFLRSGLPHRPSVIVDSGGGLHAYWLFHELWTLDGPDDVEHAAAVVRGWQQFIRSRTSHDIDSTHDLARVLRVPGTRNCKNGSILDVVVVEDSSRGFDASDFEEWLAADERAGTVIPMVSLGPNPQPPGLKFMALMDDRVFRETWEKRRKLPNDQSDSAYCLSLATTAAMAGWSDQEIADLLAAWRTQQKSVPKRPGWYAITIARARTGHGVSDAVRQAEVVERIAQTPEPDEKLAGLSALLGFQLLRVVRRVPPAENKMLSAAYYVLETDLGNVVLMGAAEIRQRALFQERIIATLKHYPDVPQKKWTEVIKALLAVAVTEEDVSESNPYAQMRGLVCEYVERKTRTTDPLQAYDQDYVLERDGELLFSYSRFQTWLRVAKRITTSQRDLPQMLTAIGCRKQSLEHLNRGGRRTRLAFWTAPHDAEEV